MNLISRIGPLVKCFNRWPRRCGIWPSRRGGGAQPQEQAVIPYTAALDDAIMALIDDLIDLRYDAGQVQLRLFSQEGL